MEEAITHQPARKKAKLNIPIVCQSCWDTITGPYSTPCLKCRKPWCPECVKQWFTMATEDSDSMPARCCGIVTHHGVAGGILSDADYEAYKLRYDERTTSNPLYCPVSTCSTFIPPRLINCNTDTMQGTISCITCFTPICMKCKQIADTDHVCKEEVAATQIKAFNYKICPKCGTGIMKMHGCDHLRCTCGAHFCFACLRAINVCHRNPCSAAMQAEGQYEDEEIEDEEIEDEENGDEENSDEDAQGTGTNAEQTSGNLFAEMIDEIVQAERTGASNAMQVASHGSEPDFRRTLLAFAESPNTDLNEAESSARSNPAVIPGTPPSELAITNLDDPDAVDWAAEDYDFGEDPSGEDFDVWGCTCEFIKLREDVVDKHWMDLKYLECMECFEQVYLNVTPQLFHGLKGGVERPKDSLAWHCEKCGVVVCAGCAREKKETVKESLMAHGRHDD